MDVAVKKSRNEIKDCKIANGESSTQKGEIKSDNYKMMAQVNSTYIPCVYLYIYMPHVYIYIPHVYIYIYMPHVYIYIYICHMFIYILERKQSSLSMLKGYLLM